MKKILLGLTFVSVLFCSGQTNAMQNGSMPIVPSINMTSGFVGTCNIPLVASKDISASKEGASRQLDTKQFLAKLNADIKSHKGGVVRALDTVKGALWTNRTWFGKSLTVGTAVFLLASAGIIGMSYVLSTKAAVALALAAKIAAEKNAALAVKVAAEKTAALAAQKAAEENARMNSLFGNPAGWMYRHTLGLVFGR